MDKRQETSSTILSLDDQRHMWTIRLPLAVQQAFYLVDEGAQLCVDLVNSKIGEESIPSKPTALGLLVWKTAEHLRVASWASAFQQRQSAYALLRVATETLMLLRLCVDNPSKLDEWLFLTSVNRTDFDTERFDQLQRALTEQARSHFRRIRPALLSGPFSPWRLMNRSVHPDFLGILSALIEPGEGVATGNTASSEACRWPPGIPRWAMRRCGARRNSPMRRAWTASPRR